MAGAISRFLGGLSAASQGLPGAIQKRAALEGERDESIRKAAAATSAKQKEDYIKAKQFEIAQLEKGIAQMETSAQGYADLGSEGDPQRLAAERVMQQMVQDKERKTQDLVAFMVGQPGVGPTGPGQLPQAPGITGWALGGPRMRQEAPGPVEMPMAPPMAATGQMEAPGAIPEEPATTSPPITGFMAGRAAKVDREIQATANKLANERLSRNREAYKLAADDIDAGSTVEGAQATYKQFMPDATPEELADTEMRLKLRYAPVAETDEQWEDIAKMVATNPRILDKIPSRDIPQLLKTMGKLGLIYDAPLTEKIAMTMTEMDTAIWQLGQLSGLVEERPDMFGLIQAKVYPLMYGSEVYKDSKAIDAQLKLINQGIAKALEGGVLRLEDEKKYKLMLPQLGDMPEIANAKIKAVLASMIYKREKYLGYLRDAGYYTRVEAIPQDVYRSMRMNLPVDPDATDFRTMMYLLPYFEELGPEIAKRYPDEWGKAVDDYKTKGRK